MTADAAAAPRGRRPWPRSGTRTLRLALVLLAVTLLVLAGVDGVLLVDGPGEPVWALLLFVGAAVLYVLAGLVAWLRRPSNGTGALLCLGGLSLLLAALQNTDVPALVAIGLISGEAPIGVMLHVLLAFPSGRLGGALPRALVAAGYAITIVLESPTYLLSDTPGAGGVLEVAHRPGLVDAAVWAQRSTGAAVIVVTAMLLARRLRAASAEQRRVLGWLYAYGVFAILFLETAVNVLKPLFGLGAITVFVLQISAAAGIPLVFALGVLRGRFARTGGIEELGAWLGRDGAGRPQLRDAIADALGDASLELLFWLREDGRYVDATGGSAELPRTGSDRAMVEVELAGSPVGAIIYDPMLIADAELVRAAGRVVSLALERERLTVELLTSREALRASRARIVEATDRERRRIARDLHDGLQAQLVLLALRTGRLAADPAAAAFADQAAELQSGLVAASDELRRLVQGVMPALLIERGLHAATEDLVDRMPVPTRLEATRVDGPLPPAVESIGYFVVAEALTNAVKHSRARQVVVRLARVDGRLEIEVRDDGVGGARFGGGSGLSGIADRLDVLGGRLRVHSTPGGGTALLAEVPCAS